MKSKEREVEKILKKAAKLNKDTRKVSDKKVNFVDLNEKKLQPKDSKDKASVFKFGAEARKTVSDQIKPTEKEKTG